MIISTKNMLKHSDYGRKRYNTKMAVSSTSEDYPIAMSVISATLSDDSPFGRIENITSLIT